MQNTPKTFFEQQIDHIATTYGLPEHHYIQVRQSRTFMEQCLSEKIELEKIAAAAFMSRFHYIRIFKLVYGLTPREYLKDLRINKARQLLRRGMSVTQVCFDVGYESIPTFSSAFKRGTGYSPKTYQELNNSNPE